MYNDIESLIQLVATQFVRVQVYIYIFILKQRVFLRVSCVFGSRWWVHLISTYDALYDMQSPIETCKAPQNNIIESI